MTDDQLISRAIFVNDFLKALTLINTRLLKEELQANIAILYMQKVTVLKELQDLEYYAAPDSSSGAVRHTHKVARGPDAGAGVTCSN